ncbi:unnamed protein product [marine sediment metagenome]|uniref:Uncharacterized protein n=1 Tax=marine sediment metagenome TaxID=412755 RepID=X1EIP6_9ZZZZ
MNPEQIIEDIDAAVKHRCVSNSATWYIIYYHDRICCVPSNAKVPPEIILGQFTEDQAQAGFTTRERDGINEYAVHFFKELYK